MFLTINRKVRETFRRLKDYFRPRSNLKEKWYIRVGYLAYKAL